MPVAVLTRPPRRTSALLAGAVLSTVLTAPALVLTAAPALAATPLSLAQAEVGVVEGSSRANSYGAAVGRYDSTSNYAWCATFLSWLMQQSGANPVRSAAVGDWVGKAKRGTDGLSVTSSPQPGDLVAYDWDGNGDYAYPNRHIGMVESLQSSTQFTAIEGNTGNPSGSNDGVYRKSRASTAGYSVLYIRVAGASSSTTPTQPRPDAPDGWYTQDISSPVYSGVGIASQGSGSLDAFFVDNTGAVVQRYYRGTGSWSVGANFGAPRNGASGRPGAESWAAGRLDVFQRTATGELAQRYYTGGSWSGWAYPPVGTLATSPAVASWGDGRLDLFSVDGAGRLTHAWHAGGVWNGFRTDVPMPSGVSFAGAPAAVSWGSGRLDVVARATDGRVFQTYYNNGWGPWRDLTASTGLRAAAGDSLAVSSWGVGRLDVFVKGTDGYHYHQWYSNNVWSAFQNLGSTSPNGPAAVSWGPERVDLFYRSPSSQLGHDWFQR